MAPEGLGVASRLSIPSISARSAPTPEQAAGCFRSAMVAAGLFRKLAQIFAAPAKPERPRPAKKLPRSVTRVAENRAKIELGRDLLTLREQTPNNRKFGELVRAKYNLEAYVASEMM